MQTEQQRYTPRELAMPNSMNPDGQGIIPYKYDKVLRMIKSGEIKAVNIGGKRPKWIVLDEAVKEWWKEKSSLAQN